VLIWLVIRVIIVGLVTTDTLATPLHYQRALSYSKNTPGRGLKCQILVMKHVFWSLITTGLFRHKEGKTTTNCLVFILFGDCSIFYWLSLVVGPTTEINLAAEEESKCICGLSHFQVNFILGMIGFILFWMGLLLRIYLPEEFFTQRRLKTSWKCLIKSIFIKSFFNLH